MREQVERILQAQGLSLSGFCPFETVRPFLLPCRAAARLPHDAKTVIVALFPYYLGEEAYARGNISRYAVVPDYHLVAGRMLEAACAALRAQFPAARFEAFVDNSPIPEVFVAACAGLGVIGQNGLLLHPRYGSWVFIGEIVTDLPLPVQAAAPSACKNCGRCRTACPTHALDARGFHADRCLSARTQQKGELDEQTAALIRQTGCAWGCDLCQLACPYNADVALTPIKAFRATARPRAEAGGDLSDRAYAWRGPQVIARNLRVLEQTAQQGTSLAQKDHTRMER